jgi:ABC-type multidrug transport system ATPase subunit/pSer/pThr/pTyr-binding forkhead associated (FHA) protein
MRVRIIASSGETSERIVTMRVVRLGRNPACEIAFDPEIFPTVSGEHAKIEKTAKGYLLTHLSRSNKTLLNEKAISGSVPIGVGDCIRLGLTGPTIEVLALQAAVANKTEGSTPPPNPAKTMAATPQHLAMLRGSRGANRMEIGEGGIIGREKGDATYVLDHPHISRRHARLTVADENVFLHDLGSSNGTFVNGSRLKRKVKLKEGDRIEVGPFSLVFDGEALVSRSRSNNIELVARKLGRTVKDRATGKPLKLLTDINLVISPGEFVCLLGPSGSGKSTLMAILSGRNAPDKGKIQVNGEDLYENFAAIKQDIAVVPQKDILHDSLAVGAALRYTAELRLPPDTSRREINESVAAILEVVGLTKRRGTLIRHLSGGQVKRASLANEIMSKPSLLFLDEVTSGLDEQTDRAMMELFRQLAEGGKTVVCITHSLANVEATCHLVVILTEGGRLAFVGTPAEARTYFAIDRLGDVYKVLEKRAAAEWQAAFQKNPLFATYVRNRLPAQAEEEEEESEGSSAAAEQRTSVSAVRQAWILTRRYVSIWTGDVMALLTILAQAVLVAVLIGLVFGRLSASEDPVERTRNTLSTVNLLFLLNVSCFWFGCNNAAKELVKERVIYSRERDFNLRIDSYFVSKFVVLVFVGLMQVSVLFGVVKFWCDPPGSLVLQWCTLAVLALAGTALGLLISAFSKTEEVSIALVPVVIIPQIILSGVIASLSGAVEWLAKGVITTYSGMQALKALLPEDDRAVLNMSDSTFGSPIAIVFAQAFAFVVIAILTLWWRGRPKA